MLAVIYDGVSRAEAARTGGVTRQIVRDWVERFNEGGPDALVERRKRVNRATKSKQSVSIENLCNSEVLVLTTQIVVSQVN